MLYPYSPANADLSQFKPSREFKKEVIRVLFAVISFFVVYLALVTLTISLAAGVSYLGILLILLKPAFITLMVGIGMMSMGLLVLFFLIKFIFSIKRTDRSGFIEIRKADHPDLFSFIRTLSKETKTKLPKRIFLAPGVNASVFYDSSFFSMFFPVRKNLLIGLGLINSVNMSEFKSVIAHEFGHFSQGSMRLGSYVYNVNKLIHNLLYENNGYANAIDSWASASGYFALFAVITVKIVRGIQWILQKLYLIINKSNLSLSRQMEHHADAVSAYVSGSNHLYPALNRIEIGDSCYNILIDIYNKWISGNFKPDNIYSHHQEVLLHYTTEKELNDSNGLPMIDSLFFSKVKKRRVFVEDQWASHPGKEERNHYITSLNIAATGIIHEKAWILFKNPESIQTEMTDLLFRGVNYSGAVQVLDREGFREKYLSEYQNSTFQKEYRGFYDNRKLSTFDPEELINENNIRYESFEDLFSVSNTSLVAEKDSVENDLALLREINGNRKVFKSYDYEGRKYDISEADRHIRLLEDELSSINKKITEADMEIFKYFRPKLGDEVIINLYKNYYAILDDFEKCIRLYNEIYPHLSVVYAGQVKIDEAYAIIDNVKKHERSLKTFMKDRIDVLREGHSLDIEEIKKLERFLSVDREYVDRNGYKDDELSVLNESLNIFISAMAEREFDAKRNLLQNQLDTLKPVVGKR